MELPIGILVARKDLIAKLIEKEFPAKTSLKLKVLTREVSKYFELYEEQRIKLVQKYGEETDGKISVKEDGENYALFVKELTDVANQKVEVVFPTLTEDDLTSNNINISTRDLLEMEVFYETKEEIPEVVAQ